MHPFKSVPNISSTETSNDIFAMCSIFLFVFKLVLFCHCRFGLFELISGNEISDEQKQRYSLMIKSYDDYIKNNKEKHLEKLILKIIVAFMPYTINKNNRKF